VERLLETIVSKMESYEEDEKLQKIMTPESDVLTPYTTTAAANPNVAENAPFLSLFENSVVLMPISHLDVSLTIPVRPP
jgi:hypothetical protein